MRLLTQLKSEGRRSPVTARLRAATSLLNFCGIGPGVLDFIADRNPLKHGLYSPGMRCLSAMQSQSLPRAPTTYC